VATRTKVPRMWDGTQGNPQTVMEWLHRYNEAGSEALVYHCTSAPPALHNQGMNRG